MLEKMMEELNMQTVPACFPNLYEAMKDTWPTRAQQILSETYIRNILTQYQVLTDWTEQILEAARQVRQHASLCLLVCLLEKWVREDWSDAGRYQAPKGTDPGLDFLHLFPALPTIPESVAYLRGRNLPEGVIADTIAEYDYCVELCANSLGRPAFDFGRLQWIRRLIRNRLIHIGRFKYDLPGKYMKGFRVYRNKSGELTVLADGIRAHRSGGILGSAGMEDAEGSFCAEITETDTAVTGHPIVNGLVQRNAVTLEKSAWELCLSPENRVLNIHIPPGGGFDGETMEESFTQARTIFQKCYPDYPFRAFFCSTWLLSPQLREILKPESNILAFQNRFIRIPFQSNGKGCFFFLFGLPGMPEDLTTLPESTSLQRAVKQLYLRGGYLHEGEGFFF